MRRKRGARRLKISADNTNKNLFGNITIGRETLI